MKRQYLGDSYDAVKRLWQEIFAQWAPLHADPRFVPEDVRTEFTAFTRIPIMTQRILAAHSILNDPDTGIRLPTGASQAEGRSYITLSTICSQLKNASVRCVITYDQSNHRKRGLTPESQRKAKLQWLRREKISAFYYVSHAPFLFAFSKPKLMRVAITRLQRAGVPSSRIERAE